MDLHTFIREHRLPRSRIVRIVRNEVNRRLERSEWEDLETPEIETEWAAIGLAVRLPPGSTRLQYTVTDSEKLLKLIRDQAGFKPLLSEEEVEHLVRAAQVLLMLMPKSGETPGPWVAIETESGERIERDGDSIPGFFADQARQALDRLGLSGAPNPDAGP